MADLQQDLLAAIVATIAANGSRFSALGSAGAALRVEGHGQPVALGDGRAGKCLVRPLPWRPVDGTDYTESTHSEIPFMCEFDLLDRKDATNARSVIQQAMAGTFRDRGAAMFANFTDNGSNRLGASGRVFLGEATEPEGDPDRPHVECELTVSMWHKVPLA